VIKLALETVENRLSIGMLVTDQPELRADNESQQAYSQLSGASLLKCFPAHSGR